MGIYEMIGLTICVLGIAICIVGIIICFIRIDYDNKKLKRNSQVCDFRIQVLHDGTDDYYKLPTYEEMLDSSKELTKENWIK